MTGDKGLPLRYFLYVVFKHKQMIAVLFFSIVLTVLVGNLLMKPVYQSSAKILLEKQRDDEKALLFQMNLGTDYSQYNWVNAEVEILRSRPVVERVIRQLHLMEQLETPDAGSNDSLRLNRAIEKFFGSYVLETTKDAPVITIRFNSSSPVLAARVVEAIIENYKKYRQELVAKSTQFQFVNRQLEQVRRELQELENKAVNYTATSGLAMPEEYGKILYEKLADYEKQLTQVRANRIALQTRLNMLKRQLSDSTSVTIPVTHNKDVPSEVEYIVKLRTKLLDLQLKREKLLEKFTPEYVEVRDVEKEIATVQQKLRESASKYLTSQETELRALYSQEQVLEKNIADIQEEIRKFVQERHQIQQISRQIKEKQELYSVLRKQAEEMRISLAKAEGGVLIKVISPPVVPVDPIRPRRKLNVILSVVLALIVSLGSAFASEYFRKTFSSVEEVENLLGVPVLASIHDFRDVKLLE